MPQVPPPSIPLKLFVSYKLFNISGHYVQGFAQSTFFFRFYLSDTGLCHIIPLILNSNFRVSHTFGSIVTLLLTPGLSGGGLKQVTSVLSIALPHSLCSYLHFE